MGKKYLAYGSNLNMGQMAMRCPNAKVIGRAVLYGYRLAFSGSPMNAHATVLPEEGGMVPVLIWQVSDRDERYLDRYEGFPHYYYKRDLTAVMESGEEVTAMAYIMTPRKGAEIPSSGYVSTIRQGYEDCKFDKTFLLEALERNLKEARSLGKYKSIRLCPVCGSCFTEAPAVSRRDNTTEICPNCGIREALEAYLDSLEYDT